MTALKTLRNDFTADNRLDHTQALSDPLSETPFAFLY